MGWAGELLSNSWASSLIGEESEGPGFLDRWAASLGDGTAGLGGESNGIDPQSTAPTEGLPRLTSWEVVGDKTECGLAEGPVEPAVLDALDERLSLLDPERIGPRLPNEVDGDERYATGRVLQNIKDSSACIDITDYAEADQARVMEDFFDLAEVGNGRTLLSELSEDREGDAVYFGAPDGHGATTRNYETGVNQRYLQDEWGECDDRLERDGEGGISLVYLDPGVDLARPESIPSTCATPWYPMRSDSVLDHELNHALHMQNGERLVAPGECTPLGPGRSDASGYFEEQRATGLPPFEEEPLSERRYREEKRMLGKGEYADRAWYYPSLGCP